MKAEEASLGPLLKNVFNFSDDFPDDPYYYKTKPAEGRPGSSDDNDGGDVLSPPLHAVLIMMVLMSVMVMVGGLTMACRGIRADKWNPSSATP